MPMRISRRNSHPLAVPNILAEDSKVKVATGARSNPLVAKRREV
jgi:hypothetical protein